MKKISCPCCGNYTIDVYEDEEVIVEICEVCFWQYDFVAQKFPNKIIGPNRTSLKDAQKNYIQFGAYTEEFINIVREALEDELPENN